MPKADELKSFPFCGNKPLMYQVKDGGWAIDCAYCPSLEMYGEKEIIDSYGACSYYTKEELINIWNTRSQPK